MCKEQDWASTDWTSDIEHYGMWSFGLITLCCADLLSHVRLFATPWTVALHAPLSVGILQARILEQIAMPSSRGSSRPRNQTGISFIGGRFFTSQATREALDYLTSFLQCPKARSL